MILTRFVEARGFGYIIGMIFFPTFQILCIKPNKLFEALQWFRDNATLTELVERENLAKIHW